LRVEAALKRLKKSDKEAVIGVPDILRHLNVSPCRRSQDASQAV
jgi:hypothetical protein